MRIGSRFCAAAIGARTAALALADSPDPNSPYSIALSGTGLIPVSVSATSLKLASSAVGNTSAAKNITITNNQTGPISLSPVVGGANPVDFLIAASSTCGATLAANSKCVYSVAFSPTGIGARTATLSLTDSPDPNSPYAISLSGTGLIPVSLSTTSLTLGSSAVGNTSATKNITITNNQNGPISLSPVAGGANPADFAIAASSTCAATLAANSKCVYSVAFSPTAIGARTATLSLSDSPDPNSPYAISLSGTGLIPVSVSTTRLTLGSSAVGNTSATKNIAITNNQTGPLSLDPVLSGANAGDFALSASSTCGTSLAANSKCVYSVAFSPSAIGARTAALVLTDSPDPNSPYTIALSGTGG